MLELKTPDQTSEDSEEDDLQHRSTKASGPKRKKKKVKKWPAEDRNLFIYLSQR